MSDAESYATDGGLLASAISVVQLSAIAIVVVVPETLRRVGCWLAGRTYRPPTQRIVEDGEEVDR